MRRAFVLALTLALGACGGPPSGSNLDAVDINAAAADAQGSIDTYAANALEAAHPVPRRARPTPIATPTVSVEPRADAQAAVDAVERYYAALAERRYGDAWAMWDDAGAASRTSAEAFAAGAVRYANYRPTIGRPGDVEAGAGQRFVQVPVTVAATVGEGGAPVVWTGIAVLHRTGDIDGATDAQQHWHVRQLDLKLTIP